MKKNIVIIGGGAAGFFVAANLPAGKFNILIVEQNSDVLQKVKISGGGRCNVSHACFDPRDLVGFYPRGNKELLSVFTRFQPGDTMDWFEKRGVALKIEDDNRIFPMSDSSQTIINTLKDGAQANGAVVKTSTTVKEIRPTASGYEIITNQGNFPADTVVYTTGSAPKSLKMLASLGHSIVPPVPSLFTFNIKDPLLSDLPGTSFETAEVSIPSLKTSESGPLLITHWGLSGPAILKTSAWEARNLADVSYRFDLKVNFISLDSESAEKRFLDFKQAHPKKTIGQAKIFEVTHRFWSKILELCTISPEKQIANISGKEMKQIITHLCDKSFTVNGKSTFKDEFVTAGGVSLKEINFKNMASRVLPDFYLAGEVLNIDAVTGGFNFQACWSEAWLIAKHLEENP